MNEQKILEDAIETFGVESQLDKLVEECAELIQAVQKYKRLDYSYPVTLLINEAVDVEIMLEQLKLLILKRYPTKGGHWITEREFKLERLEGLIRAERSK